VVKRKAKKQATLPVEKRKGCAYSNMAKEGPNGRCSKNLTSQFKPRLMGERGPKRR
jgi:hypothetical protein